MSTTLNELVRDRIRAHAGAQSGDPQQREQYVDGILNTMTNVELLSRISDAIRHGVRTQWLY